MTAPDEVLGDAPATDAIRDASTADAILAAFGNQPAGRHESPLSSDGVWSTQPCSTDAPSHARSQQVEDRPVTESEAVQSLNALLNASMRYNQSRAYAELLTFMRKFHWYAPFNALLVHIQRPGATYVATARRWRDLGREVAAEAQVVMILQPFGPVMFVYDVSQTLPLHNAPALPPEVLDPYVTRSRLTDTAADSLWAQIASNAVRDGVAVDLVDHGTGSAGFITTTAARRAQEYVLRVQPSRQTVGIPVRYDLRVNSAQQGASALATLVHELGHLYCGHLGTPDAKWWPDRRSISHVASEFEAESVAAIVMQRWDPSVHLPPHLAQYLRRKRALPPDVSLERIVNSAEEILSMARTVRLPMRVPGKRKNEK